MSIHPCRVLPAVAVVVAGLLVAVVVAPASAHGGAGELTVVGVEPTGPGQLGLTVDVAYVNDGHPAEVRSLVIEGTGPGGAGLAPSEPFRPTDQVGRYAAVVDVPAPGSWTVVLSSTFPPARVELVVEVPDAGPAEDDEPAAPDDGHGGDPSDAASDAASDLGEGLVEPVAVGAGSDGGGAGAPGPAGDGGSPVAWLVAAVAAVAAVVGVGVLRRRRVGT
jgi:hypothetical protein